MILCSCRLAADTGIECSHKSPLNHQNKTGYRQYRGTAHCLMNTYHLNGIKGIYAGFYISFVGACVYRGLHLGGYDSFKDYFQLHSSSDGAMGSALLSRFVAAQVSNHLLR
jgi:hypothetical protein